MATKVAKGKLDEQNSARSRKSVEDLFSCAYSELLAANPETNHDAVQTAALNVLNRIRSGATIRKPREYLSVAVKHAKYNKTRDDQRHDSCTPLPDGNRAPSENLLYLPRIEQTIEVRQLLEILREELNDYQRDILVLMLRGDPQKEIARKLGRARSTINKQVEGIRKRLQRIRQRLKHGLPALLLILSMASAETTWAGQVNEESDDEMEYAVEEGEGRL
ncbi:MAG: sigma-70 family RNA polymerase sigma factor [bacterium]|nr:sigma-70 family RNA polymerase sigma factor [bacterium]